ncbi:MAG: hypothetical protein ACXW0Q_07055 [Methylovulum sp.]
MSNFLWVEDFENSPKVTASNVFGSVFADSLFFEDKRALKKSLENQGVFIELSFQDGWSVIAADLEKQIDYVILDIDLPAHSGDGINGEILELLETFEGYQKLADEAEDEALLEKKCAELKARAGFYLYTKLVMELGFPKQHILFCSNHAENNKTILAAFATAKLASPKIYQKSDSYVQDWVKSRYENSYSRLRRAIIEGCRQLKASKEKLRFDKFSADEKKLAFLDIDDYLDILENFLPLREPSNKDALYKLFIRTLAHEWEESVEPKKLNDDQTTLAFSWIMKMTRNWMAHNSTAIFNNLTEQDVAYLFICNMRAIFGLGIEAEDYEKNLFLLFNKSEESEAFKESELIVTEKRIPLVKQYVSYFNEKTKRIQVHNILHDLQNDKTKLKAKGDDFFINGLYHSFWFLTSEHDDKKDKAKEDRDNQNKVYISRYYTFNCFNYAQSEFLLKFSSHIYSRSFSMSEKS